MVLVKIDCGSHYLMHLHALIRCQPSHALVYSRAYSDILEFTCFVLCHSLRFTLL